MESQEKEKNMNNIILNELNLIIDYNNLKHYINIKFNLS